MWAALGLEFLHNYISIIYNMTALLLLVHLFVLCFKLFNKILYIFFLISSENAVQESEGVLMVCEVGGGGGGYDLICTSCLVVSGIVPKTVVLLPNSCDRIWTLKYILITCRCCEYDFCRELEYWVISVEYWIATCRLSLRRTYSFV